MLTIRDAFRAWSNSKQEALSEQLPGFCYDRTVNDVIYFTVDNPLTLINILIVYLGSYEVDSDRRYRYKDGTIGGFIKGKGWWEFRNGKAIIARIRPV